MPETEVKRCPDCGSKWDMAFSKSCPNCEKANSKKSPKKGLKDEPKP